jgi:ATP-dependent RNA helicase RhlE
MTFESLGLAPELLQAVRECGYTTPTPIQEQAIPHLLAGRDLMGCAQTGTGKTAAFALPILHQIRGSERGQLRALVLVPTRELAIQVGRNIREYGECLGIRSTAVYGGVPLGPQEMMLRYGVDILVATPGRLKDHMWRGLVDFRSTRFLVLDEADRMLDMGFIDAVREIVNLIPKERQTMLFSATLDREIVRLARDILRDPIRVAVAPSATVADGIEHVMIQVQPGGKKAALEDLIQRNGMSRTLIFTRTRRGASQLAIHLKRQGSRASSIHSDKTQSQRVAALEAFREGKIDYLVATDIAARGLDVQGISHVVNFDVPRHAEDYVHRIGRTARAGLKGIAISLVAPEDRETVRSIERLIGRSLIEGGAAVEALAPKRLGGSPSERSPRRSSPRSTRSSAGGSVRSSEGGSSGAVSRRQGTDRERRFAAAGAVARRDEGPRSRGPRRDLDLRTEHPARIERVAVVGSRRTEGTRVQGPRQTERPVSVASGRRERVRPAASRETKWVAATETKQRGSLLQRVFSQLGVQLS